MVLRQEWVVVKGKQVYVKHLTGYAKDTVPDVLAMLKDVHPSHAGLSGTNSWNKKADREEFLRGDVMARVIAHGDAEYRDWNLIGIIVVNNYDQLTSLRVLGDKFRGDHELCGSPCIESDFVVALEREGLSSDTFSNVNSYGGNVAVSKLLP
jgi:hypothetical protein